MTKAEKRREHIIGTVAEVMAAMTEETTKELGYVQGLSLMEAMVRGLAGESGHDAHLLMVGASIVADAIVYKLYGENGLRILKEEFDRQELTRETVKQ